VKPLIHINRQGPMDQGRYEQEDPGSFMDGKRDLDEPQSRTDLEQHQKKIDHSEDQNDGTDFHG